MTLLGPGGLGNPSRLRVRGSPCGGVFRIDSVGLTKGSLIPDQLAKALGLRDLYHTTVSDAVRDHFRGRHALQVFYNCERLN